METNIIKLHPISSEDGKAYFNGDLTIIELDPTPNFVKYLVAFDDGRMVYAQCDNGIFTYKASFEPERY